MAGDGLPYRSANPSARAVRSRPTSGARGSIAVYGPSAARGDADADRGEPGDGDGDGESRRSEGNKRYECRTGTV